MLKFRQGPESNATYRPSSSFLPCTSCWSSSAVHQVLCYSEKGSSVQNPPSWVGWEQTCLQTAVSWDGCAGAFPCITPCALRMWLSHSCLSHASHSWGGKLFDSLSQGLQAPESRLSSVSPTQSSLLGLNSN
jgi:hypothetical protein